MIALIVGVVGGFAALLLRGSTLSVAPPPGPAPSPAASSPPAVDPPPVVANTPPPTPPVAVTPPTTPPAAPPVASKPPASPMKPPAASSQPPAKPAANTKPVSSTPTASQPASSQTSPASNTKPTSSASTKPAPGSGLGGNEPAQPTAMAVTPKVAKPIAPPAAPAPVKPKLAPNASGVSRSQFLKSYRVAVGSFSGAARANSAASSLRARGLPAVALPSGGVMIVVVGPYTNESAARAALNRVQPSYPDAILYRPDGSRSRAPTAPTATPSVTTSPSAAQPATAPDEGAYLQVAAFRNITAATPLLTKLRGSGYPAFLRSSPDGFTRVLVGPLSRDALRQARADLQKRGHQPFAVTK